MENKRDLDENGSSESTLRDAAEEKLGKFPGGVPSEPKDKTPEEIIHELHVHQFELEMQNEELKRVQLELEKSRNKYQELYDFIPVGYFILDHKGLIKEVNLSGAALLGIPRSELITRGFGRFVAPENLDQWDQHIMAKAITDRYNVCLGGNIQLTVVMLLGSQADNMKAVVDIIDSVPPGNLIVSPGCDMPYDVPIENTIAAGQAARQTDQVRSICTTTFPFLPSASSFGTILRR